MSLKSKPPRTRVIHFLRTTYPGAWRWDADTRRWMRPESELGPAGEAWLESHLAPRYDGDDHAVTMLRVVLDERHSLFAMSVVRGRGRTVSEALVERGV